MLYDYEIKDDGHYLFICAVLAERESEFIDRTRWERLAGSSSIGDFLKVLQETHYSKYINDIEKTGSLQNAVMAENRELLGMLNKNLKEQHNNIKEFYLLRLDLHNIKIIMKADVSGKDMDDIFHEFSYTYAQLKNAFENGKFDGIDIETGEIINYARELMHTEKNQRTRELLLERFYLNRIHEHFSRLGSPMLLDLLRHIIDMYNIKNIYRAKLLDESVPYSTFLYENGFLSIHELSKYEKESTDYFIQSIEKTPYVKMIFQGTHIFQQKHSFSAFESNEDEFVLKFLEQVKLSVANLEKIVYFMMRKRIEMKKLNIALTGALHNIDSERIKNRIMSV